MALVLVREIELNLNVTVPCHHPLFAWAFNHASWLMCRFLPNGGLTPYEVAFGREGQGHFVRFASVGLHRFEGHS